MDSDVVASCRSMSQTCFGWSYACTCILVVVRQKKGIPWTTCNACSGLFQLVPASEKQFSGNVWKVPCKTADALKTTKSHISYISLIRLYTNTHHRHVNVMFNQQWISFNEKVCMINYSAVGRRTLSCRLTTCC